MNVGHPIIYTVLLQELLFADDIIIIAEPTETLYQDLTIIISNTTKSNKCGGRYREDKHNDNNHNGDENYHLKHFRSRSKVQLLWSHYERKQTIDTEIYGLIGKTGRIYNVLSTFF